MSDKKHLTEKQLETYFEAERMRDVTPSAQVMAAILQDAKATIRKPCFYDTALDRLRDWLAFTLSPPVFTALACAVFGLYLGYASPVAHLFESDETNDIIALSSSSAFDGIDFFEYLKEDS